MIKPGMYLSDRYEIIDKVGSGGMADVYKARDHKLNRFVAIKILKTEYNNDKTFVQKFRGEAQSAAGLSHPNIVNIYDVGEDEGMHYIIMELIEGITLKRFIERKGKLEIREAIGIGIQIAQGMEVAHANHIIHRDIKPQNIIISREGKVKVTDFGIAKATSSNTITSNAMGSVHYFSPEQARGGYCDEKSDIYSLGVTMYEMISGHVPFEGDNAVSVALLHIQNEAKSLRELDPSVPVSVDKIVQKCMQKKPERRYLTVSELIADLKRSISEPDVDFVVIPDILKEKQPTVVLSRDELETIRKASSIKEVSDDSVSDDQDIDDSYDDSYDDDEYDDYDDEDYDEDDEEEDDDEEPSKKEKLILLVAIGSAVFLAIVVILIILKLAGFIGTNDSKKVVDPKKQQETSISTQQTEEPTEEPTEDSDAPNLIGKTREEAQEIAEKNGYTLRIEQVVSAKPEGIIVDQDVDGNIIYAKVSDGSGNIKMSDVTGMSAQEAKSQLQDDGFTGEFEIEYINDEDVEVGRVVKTDPEAGTEVKIVDLEKITLYVSTGESTKTFEVPSLLGKTREEAEEAIKAAGMELGSVSESENDDYEAGKVCYQSKTAGAKVSGSTKIDITISTGKKEEEPEAKIIVPDLSGKTESEATKSLEDAGLKVGRIYMDYSDTVEKDLVIRQTVKPGSEVEKGSSVTFTLSLGPNEATQEPTKEPEKHTHNVNVTVRNYAENPFTSPELLEEGDDDSATYGDIKIKVIYNGTTVVYNGSVSSSYDQFDASGFSYSFSFDTDTESIDKSMLDITYTVNNSNYNFAGESDIEIN